MRGRDPDEAHRAATPLELFFDLVIVVAIAVAAASLHHGIAEDHILESVLGYLLTFFAIWWAWMSFTWFAAGYDTDDVPYRVAVFVQMAGAIIMAAGVGRAIDAGDWSLVLAGLHRHAFGAIVPVAAGRPRRPAEPDPEPPLGRWHRIDAGLAGSPPSWSPGALRHRLLRRSPRASWPCPCCGQGRPSAGVWHAEHIAERYGLLTIIVLGEIGAGRGDGLQLGRRRCLLRSGLLVPRCRSAAPGLRDVVALLRALQRRSADVPRAEPSNGATATTSSGRQQQPSAPASRSVWTC